MSQNDPRYLSKGHIEVRREGEKKSSISQSCQGLAFQISRLFIFIFTATAMRFPFKILLGRTKVITKYKK